MDSNNQNTNQNQTGSNNQNQGLGSLAAGAGIDLGQFGMGGNQDNNEYLQSIVAGLNATAPIPQTNYQNQEQLNMLLKDLNPGSNQGGGAAQNLNIQNLLGQPRLNSLGRGDLQGLMMPNLNVGLNQDPFGLGIGLPGFQNLVGNIPNIPMNMPNQPQMQNYGVAQPQMNFGGGGGGFPQRQPGMLVPGSAQHAAAFHAKGPDNQIKIFVGGLAFQTQEADLIEYFKEFGRVDDAIVMRDKQTNRGRGFGFVKIQFENKQKAQDGKNKIVSINQNEAHIINDKRVDVKSADDYVKPQPGQAPPHNINQGGGGYQGGQYGPGSQMKDGNNDDKFANQFNDPVLNVTKPNPYVTAKKKGDKEVVFEYPKSKIFVGGLDFKLQNEDLKQHFSLHGTVESAVILKDINTGQSRGFGFVTFKDEATAQDLIQNLHVTNINGRKVDIKSAEPKQASSNQPPPTPPPRKIPNYGEDRPSYQSTGPDQGVRRYATMGNYDDQYGDRDQRNTRDNRRGDSPDSSRDGGRNNNNNRRDYRDHREYRDDRGGPRRNNDRYGGGERKERRRYRSDSDDSNGSSSSYHRSKDRRKNRDRDRRGPHHGNQSKTDHDKDQDRDKRERSKSDR